MNLTSQVDLLLVIPVILLSALGITILHSVAPDLVRQQIILMAIGILITILISLVNYHLLEHFSWGSYILAIGLLATTLLIGQVTRGSIRWIPLGLFRLQTSEIAKPLLIIFFARILSTRNFHHFKSVLTPTLLFLLPVVLIFRQPDLGSSLVVTALWIGMMFVSGAPIKFFLMGLVITTLLIPLGWRTLADYQQARLMTFINPISDPLKTGYHLNQSLIAVGSGQVFGRGLGQGTQSQLRFLPERHTDFIFATMSEELGLIGGIILTGLLLALLARILIIAKNSPDRFGELICVGIFSLLAFQGFVNIGMNIGLVPITGITLPFISYGGSSLLSTFISLGLASSVSRFKKPSRPFEIR